MSDNWTGLQWGLFFVILFFASVGASWLLGALFKSWR